MTERSDQPQNPPAGDEKPEVYSVSQDEHGSFHLSRRDLLYAGAAIGGALLVRRACPRFGTKITPGASLQAGMSPLSGVCLHTGPSIASNIAETLKGDDLVRLVSDHPDLGWAEVATQSGQQGWVKRDSLDFSRAVNSRSASFGVSPAGTPTPADIRPEPGPQPGAHLTASVRSRSADEGPDQVRPDAADQVCGEAIQNGDFEAGSAHWTEVSTGTIIRTDWPDPYQGSWVAWFGGPDADEKLTQLFHLPDNVQNAQTLDFYIKVVTAETGDQVYDVFNLRFLDGGGSPISGSIPIANNTTPTNWLFVWVDLNGLAAFAGQDIQIQFECVTNTDNDTHFVLDVVSLDLVCGYIFLPVIIREPTPTPSPTACPTYCPYHCGSDCGTDCPSDCASDCPSYCGSDCGSDCGSHCTSDCVYICPSDCTFECIYDCTFDCIYDCSYDW